MIPIGYTHDRATAAALVRRSRFFVALTFSASRLGFTLTPRPKVNHGGQAFPLSYEERGTEGVSSVSHEQQHSPPTILFAVCLVPATWTQAGRSGLAPPASPQMLSSKCSAAGLRIVAETPDSGNVACAVVFGCRWFHVCENDRCGGVQLHGSLFLL
jgi:hypothetical protein